MTDLIRPSCVGACMPDHPIHELHDMRSEFHANPHTRVAIILASVVAVVAIIVFLLFSHLLRAPALPVDPVAQGAASAFDVAQPPPDGVANTGEAAPPPAIAPADLSIQR